MNAMLYKELRLNLHPVNYIFLLLSALMLIPSYPYYVTFFYTCLGIYFTLITTRENNDNVYSVCLPIRKRDCVLARCMLIVIIQLIQLLTSIPFAIISVQINPNAAGNLAGIEANVAFYGLSLVLLSIFNLIMIPGFYKTGYKAGKPFILSCIAQFIFIIAAEVTIQLVPVLKQTLDSSDPAMQIKQLPILAAGVIIYILAIILAYRRAAGNFDKVDL